MSTSRNSKYIDAPREKVFQAFTDPRALEQWLVPGEMKGKVHSFDLRENGGYEMSLYYPEADSQSQGKSDTKEDRYAARFMEIHPPEKISLAITFQSDHTEFSGEMIEHVTLKEKNGGTDVTIVFENIPPGINPADNEEGTASSLEKLSAFVTR